MALYMHDVYAELSIKYIVAFESNNVSTDGHVQNLVREIDIFISETVW